MKKQILVLAVFLGSAVAQAYPTSIVFAPTGDSKKQWEANASAYSSFNFTPTESPASNWFGINMGVLPGYKYGDSGTGFGGLEIGIDAISPFTYQGEAPTVKPIVNLKAQVFTENGWLPHISIGAMSLALFKQDRSQNLVYVSATKTLGSAEKNYGRFTLGWGDNLSTDHNLFNGTAPFRDSFMLLLGGYESPNFGPLSMAVDYIGGRSELSSANVALNLTPMEGAEVSVGCFFSADRSSPDTTNDGFFVDLSVSWNMAKLLAKKP